MIRQIITNALLLMCSLTLVCLSAKNVNGQADLRLDNENPVEVSTRQSTSLYCSKVSRMSGNLNLQAGNNMTWAGNAELVWDVTVEEGGKYELYLVANIRKNGTGHQLFFANDSNQYSFRLQETSGPYKNGRNFQRILLSSSVLLEEGMQNIQLYTKNEKTEDVLLDIRSIEMIPVAAIGRIEAEKKKALSVRADADWLHQSKYGLMFHWTSQSIGSDGEVNSYEDAVNNFDVERFAEMVELTGAGYVIFTIGHAEQYCPAPIESWEKCHPGKTTQRDLIEELATTLNAKGIRFLCYMHSMGTANFKDGNNPAFFKNFTTILTEFGSRYKDKIAGYWFDCWYQIYEDYPDIPFEEFYHASKIGNRDRIICLNSWIYPSVSPWQDYWAGEVASPIDTPENGYTKDGPASDLPYHALLIMEPYWVQQKLEMSAPRFTAQQLVKYITDCNQNGGAVTINLGIYQDGGVSEKALKVLTEVKTKVKEISRN